MAIQRGKSARVAKAKSLFKSLHKSVTQFKLLKQSNQKVLQLN